MNSVRARILVPVLLLLLVGNLLISLFAFRDSHHEIEEVYDAQLAQSARLLQGVLRQRAAGDNDWQRLYQAFDEAMSRVGDGQAAHPYETRLTFQIWRESGELMVRSAQAPVIDVPPVKNGFHDFTENGNEWCGFLLDDPEQGLRIWIGERDDVRQHLIERIAGHTLWPSLVGVPVLVVLIWLAIGWGLRPLRSMAQTIREREPESLEALKLVRLPKELEPMQVALNQLLIQIEGLLERERRFIADAAHELRTPLAILRIHAQNAQQAPTELQRHEALAYLVVGVDRATRIASQLLTMARLEPRVTAASIGEFELTRLVREELAELTPLALQKRVDLVLESTDDLVIRSEADALSIALQNLLTNALNFAPEGSEIRVVLFRNAMGDTYIRVEDSGPGIEDDLRERVAERFYSSGNPNGAGLGLAIVHMIMNKLNGSLELNNRPDAGLCAELRIRPLNAS